MILNKKLCLILLIVHTITVALPPAEFQKPLLGKLADTIALSQPLSSTEKHIIARVAHYFSSHTMGNEPASVEYQILGKEVQDAVGIPFHYQIPIKKIPYDSVIYDMWTAIALPYALYVNEEVLNDQSPGARRCTLLRQAIHKKYNDNSLTSLVSLSTLLASSLLSYKGIRYRWPDQRRLIPAVIAPLIGFTMYGVISLQFLLYQEKRADIEGHYAAQCYVCVQESATQRRHQTATKPLNPLLQEGYLRATDVEKIAQDLEGQHKLCAYHAQRTTFDTESAHSANK